LSLVDSPVGSVMMRNVLTIGAERPLSEGVKLMKEAKVGCIVVLEMERPVGIFTERDLVREVAERGVEVLNRQMDKVMSRPLATILPKASVWDAIALMGRLGIRRLPVVEKGKLVGILTERDIFRLILSQQHLLLESVSESMPAATREQFRGAVGLFGPEKLP